MSALHPSSCSGQTLEPFLTLLFLTPHTHTISESRGDHCSPRLHPHPGLCHLPRPPPCRDGRLTGLRAPPLFPAVCAPRGSRGSPANLQVSTCSKPSRGSRLTPDQRQSAPRALRDQTCLCLAAPPYSSLPHPRGFSHTGPSVVLKNTSRGPATVPLRLLLPLLGKLPPR